MATVQEIRNEIQAYLDGLSENKGRLFKLLRTMARFHRYNLSAQISITQHAPYYASAYATEDIWRRIGRSVPEGAQGIEIDVGRDEPAVIYEVGNTVGPRQNLIWRFDKRTDEKLFDGIEPVSGSVPEKVAALSRTRARSAGLDDEVAALATAIILTRLGYDYRNVAAEISAINMNTEELTLALANAGQFSREFLDNIADYMKKGKDEEHALATNSYFRSLVGSETEVLGREESQNAPSNDGERNLGRVSDGRGGGIKSDVPADSRRADEEAERAGIRAAGSEPDGVAGADERSEDVGQRDDAAGGVLSVEERTAGVSFEEMRDVALEKVAFLNSEITNQRIREFYMMAVDEASPLREESQKQLRLAYLADEDEVREAHEKFVDVMRDRVLAQAATLDSFNTNEYISQIFERSKNENNTEDIARTINLITSTPEELRDFSNNYLDYIIQEGLSGGADIERRMQEQLEADQRDGLGMSSPVAEYFRLRRPDDELGQAVPSDLTFADVLRQMRAGQDFEAITGVGDSFVRQVVFRQIERYDDSPLSYVDLMDMDRENYLGRSAEAEAETVQTAEEEPAVQETDNEEELVSAAATMAEAGEAVDEFIQEMQESQREDSVAQETDIAEEDENGVDEAVIEGLPPQDASVGNMDDENELGDTQGEGDSSGVDEAIAEGLPPQDSSVGNMDDAGDLGDVQEAEPSGLEEAFVDGLPPQDAPASDTGTATEEGATTQEVSSQQEETRYKYYLDVRPADLGSVPHNFESIDANDPDGRYGAIYYTRPLTAKELADYELTSEIDREKRIWWNNWDWEALDFPDTPEGNRQQREYHDRIVLLNRIYNSVAKQLTPIYILDTAIAKAIATTGHDEQKVADSLIEFSNKLSEFVTRKVELGELGNSRTNDNGLEQVNIAEAEATSSDADHSEEIQAALESTANANTKEAFRKNLLAIQTMKELEASGRTPTEEEIALMRSYVGFGGLRDQVFREGYKGWENEQQELKDALTEAEYDALRSSTLTAFYTPPEVIEAIYSSLERIGFEKGNILDPSMGSGRFFQNMPETMRKESNLFGVELDPLTGRMAKLAYPEAEISVNGFEKTTYPDNSFDLAITNVPFGDYEVYDRSEKGTFKIHDYFIAKMIEQVRPGGIVAVVTSAGTMDKVDESARRFFATKAELLDAVRLPEGAFRSAGTQVATDILIFKKRQRELTLDQVSDNYWLSSRNMETNFSSNYDDHMMVNAYFANNPRQVLGRLQPVSTQFGFSMSCVPDDNPQPIGERIKEAFQSIRGRYEPAAEEMPRPVQTVVQDGATFSFYIDEQDRVMFATPTGNSQPKLTKAQETKIREILPLRNRIRALIDMEKDSSVPDAAVQEEIKSLNRLYDSYYEQFGSIALDKDLKKAFHDDVSYPLLCSIEKIRFDAELGNVYDGKGDIFDKRIIVPHVEPDHADSALDALSISMLEHGMVDLPYMTGLTGQSQRELLRQLENVHIYYDDGKKEYVHADEYLSGDIRGKIEVIDNSIETLRRELQDYASEKVLPLESARFVPRNETEAFIVKNPYKYIRITDSNRHQAEVATQNAIEYIEAHLDDRALAATSLNYTMSTPGTKELRQKILDRYGNDLSFIAAARREGFKSLWSDEYQGLHQYDALQDAIDSMTFNKRYDPKYIHNFIQEKVEEYKGHEDALMNLRQHELNDQFEEWIQVKDAEVESYVETHLSDPRIKNLMDRINVLEQKKAALEEVKPPDVKADEIVVGLGTTWLPPKYIEAFMSDVFDMSWQAGDTCKCLFVPETGTWQITNKNGTYGPLVEHTYGYGDKMNALHLLEQALNFKSPTVYKVITVDGDEKRVPDEKATQIAQQKQDIIKDEFKKWLFKDKERTEAIVDFYNRNFNSLVPRQYNGNALTFPGMNPNIKLREHQKNAIAHTLYGGNALFAHAVGAGKTFEMVASAMEAKRMGLAHKSMIVVPNHLTEQFGAEFKQLYPEANILVATADDFKKDKRKEFCAKIATYNWDAVIIGATQFERIPMSPEYMEHSMVEQVNELVRAMEKLKYSDAGSEQNRFSIRTIETMKKKIEARLEKLRNSPKDQTVRFEDLGIDRLYVDEAHEFKNLFTYTKMSNVAGVSTADAQKTSDLYEKVRYLNDKTGEKGVVFATGTPVSNSMTELYTMMRYLEPSQLRRMHIDSFDAWASTFGETTTGFELRPEGRGFQRKTRFAKFHNMPELMAVFKEVADIKTQDMLNLDVPEAEYVVEKLQPSEEQKAILDKLVERAEAIHKGNPLEVMTKDGAMTDDNFLWITTDGKKLALDQRLINPLLPDDPNSKVNKCVENVMNVYRESEAIKGTQLIFCDLSTPSNDGSFNVYDDIKGKLIEKGVKESEVAYIHDAKDEAAKARLFAKVRTGEVRVLLGSTKKMGTGTNVQDLLVASHDLDVPWRPADLEQRAGRTIRQGNKNDHVKIFRYVTEGTFDAYLWQTLENKQRFISQVMTSKSPLRTIDDCDETTLSYAEIKAVSIGSPLIKEKLDNDNEISRLMLSKSEFFDSRKALQAEITTSLPASIKNYEEYYGKVQADIEHVKENANMVEGKEIFKIKLNDKVFSDRKEAGEYIAQCMKDGSYQSLKGEYKGMKLSMAISHDMFNLGACKLIASHMDTYDVELGADPVGNIIRLENRIQKLPEIGEKVKGKLENKKHALEMAKQEVDRPWPLEEKLAACIKRGKELDALLLEDNKDSQHQGREDEGVRKTQQVVCR